MMYQEQATLLSVFGEDDSEYRVRVLTIGLGELQRILMRAQTAFSDDPDLRSYVYEGRPVTIVVEPSE